MRLKTAIAKLEKVARAKATKRRSGDRKLFHFLYNGLLIAHPEMRFVLPEDTDPETYREIRVHIAYGDHEYETAETLMEQRPPYPKVHTDEERSEQFKAIMQEGRDHPVGGPSWKMDRALEIGRRRMAESQQRSGGHF